MKTSHSRAPFIITEYSAFEDERGNEIPCFRIYDADGDLVAETDSGKPGNVQQADAALLAASPVMLMALEQAVYALNAAVRFPVPALDTDSYAIAGFCDCAIAAAKGGGWR